MQSEYSKLTQKIIVVYKMKFYLLNEKGSCQDNRSNLPVFFWVSLIANKIYDTVCQLCPLFYIVTTLGNQLYNTLNSFRVLVSKYTLVYNPGLQ